MKTTEREYGKLYLKYVAKSFDLERARELGIGGEKSLIKEVELIKNKLKKLKAEISK